MNQRMWPGRDTGHGASGLTGLHLWMTQDGYVLSAEVSGQRLVLATTSDSPDAAGAPAGTRCEPTAIAGLAGRVPPGFGLLVDRSTRGRRVVSASVIDDLRLQEPPCGDEPDLRTERVPDQLGGVRNSVVASAGRTGARGITVVWTIGGGRQGLWVVVDRPVAGTLDAVYDAVARHAPFEPVRVLDQAELSEPARGLVSRAAAQDNGGTSPQEFSGRANVVILVVVLIGAVAHRPRAFAGRIHRHGAGGGRVGRPRTADSRCDPGSGRSGIRASRAAGARSWRAGPTSGVPRLPRLLRCAALSGRPRAVMSSDLLPRRSPGHGDQQVRPLAEADRVDVHDQVGLLAVPPDQCHRG
jgi:hypothetical protein